MINFPTSKINDMKARLETLQNRLQNSNTEEYVKFVQKWEAEYQRRKVGFSKAYLEGCEWYIGERLFSKKNKCCDIEKVINFLKVVYNKN